MKGSIVLGILFVVSLILLGGAFAYSRYIDSTQSNSLDGNNSYDRRVELISSLSKGDTVGDIQTDLKNTSFSDIDSDLNSVQASISQN